MVRSIKEEHGIKCRRHKRFKITTDSNHNKLVYPNVLDQKFDASRPNQAWVSDITYIWTNEGWLYLAGVKDLYTKELVGYAINKRMTADLVCRALNMAIKNKRPSQGLIVHSDRGSQYTSELYKSSLKKLGIKQSMNSAGGRCHDNARCESIWGRMKTELIYGRYDTKKMSMESVKSIVWRYFMSYWCNRRICSAIGGVPPAFKRKLYYEKLKVTA